MIYLDNSATTRPCEAAVAAMQEAMINKWGNPSALYDFGIQAAHDLRSARSKVASALGAEPDRVFFTSGGTEADNWAILGAAKRFGKKNKHIVTSAIEHHAVLNTIKELESQSYQVTYLKPDEAGRISAEQLRNALRKDTFLVSIMMVNNETGAVMPIEKMVKICRRFAPNAIFHTDAVQGFLKVPFQAKSLGADLISVSSHKIHGPKGAGALYIAPQLRSFPPLLIGGGQEGGFRSGTEATPTIMAFAAACEEGKASFAEDSKRERLLMEYLVSKIETLDGVRINGCHEAPHIISLSIPGLPTQNSINLLQDRGIYVSAGSACAKGHRSHVLTAMNCSSEIMDSSFRVSLSRETTHEEIHALLCAIREDLLPRAR